MQAWLQGSKDISKLHFNSLDPSAMLIAAMNSEKQNTPDVVHEECVAEMKPAIKNSEGIRFRFGVLSPSMVAITTLDASSAPAPYNTSLYGEFASTFAQKYSPNNVSSPLVQPLLYGQTTSPPTTPFAPSQMSYQPHHY